MNPITVLLAALAALTALFVAGWTKAMLAVRGEPAGAAVHWTRISHILRIFSFSTILPQIAVSMVVALFGAVLFGPAPQHIMIAGGAAMGIGALLAIAFRGRISPKAAV